MGQLTELPQISKRLSLLACATLLVYFLAFFQLRGLPFLDLPNHAARGFVIGELIWGTKFRDLFSFDLLFTPYILIDLMLAALSRVFSLETTALTVVAIAFILQPVSLVFYARARRLSTPSIITIAFLATFLASNWFFLSAFLSFSIGFAFVFFTLTCWEHCQQCSSRRAQIPHYLLYVISATFAYLAHLSSFTFLTITLTAMGILRLLNRRLSWLGLIASLLPFVGFVAIHLSRKTSQHDLTNGWLFRTPLDKLLAVGTMFVRFNYTIDILFFCILVLFIAYHLRGLLNVQLFRTTQALRGDFDILELGLTVAGFLGLYLVLPVAFSYVYDVDGRALPYLFAFLLLFALRVGERWGVIGSATSEVSGSGRHYPVRLNQAFSWSIAGGIAVTNFLYLSTALFQHNSYLVEVNKAVRAIPAHNTVLPISTTSEEGRIQTGLHNGALYTAWGEGVTPYIFNSALGEPVTFFHYKAIPYHPFQFWYQRNMPVDWSKVESTYQFAIITKPFDPTRINLPNSMIIFENNAAIVLKTRG